MLVKKQNITLWPHLNSFVKNWLQNLNPTLASLTPYPANSHGLNNAIIAATQHQQNYWPHRQTLRQTLVKQYLQINVAQNDVVYKQINLLQQPNTFAIVTAHQPVLFGGPLYFIYKAISAIVLANELNTQYQSEGLQFLPVFWIGGEDHDFEEISHIRLFGKKYQWEHAPTQGATGQMPLETLTPLVAEIIAVLGNQSLHAAELANWLQKAYAPPHNLGQATQLFLHFLFGQYGLIVLNPNEANFKAMFANTMASEVLHQTSYKQVGKTNQIIQQLGYTPQAFVREVNLFEMGKHFRSRILYNAGTKQYTLPSAPHISYSPTQLSALIEQNPQQFSPNVIMRPLYQQTILPCIAYIGGPGEVSYWLQLAENFKAFDVFYPVVLLRDMAIWADKQIGGKAQKLQLNPDDLWLSYPELAQKFLRKWANTEPNLLESEISNIKQILTNISTKANTIDGSLATTVAAESAKIISGLEKLQEKLFKAEKRKHEIELQQLANLHQKLYPENNLQERIDNFMPLYLQYGRSFFDYLLENFNPTEQKVKLFVDV
jgi:bacillithiol biosynthesis cysteine-adding enzyme BshC